jgi:AcrR family transcriptional regulator
MVADLSEHAAAAPDGAGADIRESILRAAQKRFEHYGFAKTTMAEIASDCGMSAANLYRYFASKDDIVATGAEAWLIGANTQIAAIAENRAAGAGERLHRIVNAKMRMMLALITSGPHLDELVEHVCRERKDLLQAHRAVFRRHIARVIDDGVAAGVFAPGDSLALAETFELATRLFYQNNIHREGEPAELERASAAVVDLLIRGLGGR